MKIWLTTDTHFGHEKVKEYCGRPDNHESLIHEGLKRIPCGDLLIHLGDVCIGNDEKHHRKYIIPLDCKTLLIRGNHDKKSNGWYLEHGWDVVLDSAILETFGKRILFSHQPTPKKKAGEVDLNIHGHFHNKDFRLDEFTERYEYDPMFHSRLAVELTKYQPVTLEHIVNHPVEFRATRPNLNL